MINFNVDLPAVNNWWERWSEQDQSRSWYSVNSYLLGCIHFQIHLPNLPTSPTPPPWRIHLMADALYSLTSCHLVLWLYGYKSYDSFIKKIKHNFPDFSLSIGRKPEAVEIKLFLSSWGAETSGKWVRGNPRKQKQVTSVQHITQCF